MQLKVPVTVVLGKMDNELAACIIEGRNISFSKIVEDLPKELVEDIESLEILDDTIRGHIAITSFGHSTIKAIDVGSREGTCYITRGGEITLLPTIVLKKQIIFNKDFGKWVNVLSLPIFLQNILREESRGSIVVLASRLGENLHVSFGYIDDITVRLLKYFLTKVRQLDNISMITASCVGRIPQMPLEISVISEDKYLLFRTYLNTRYKTHAKFKLLIVIASGGNIVKRYISEEICDKSFELVDTAIEEFSKIISGSVS